MNETDRLQLPIGLPVLGTVVAATVVLLLLCGVINERRRAEQLQEVEALDCTVAFPPRVRAQLKTLRSREDLTNEAARAIAAEVQALYVRSRIVEVLYSRQGAVWSVSAWNGPHPGGRRELAPEWGDWASLTAQPSCQSVSRDQRLVVGRSLALGNRTRVLVITWQSMGN